MKRKTPYRRGAGILLFASLMLVTLTGLHGQVRPPAGELETRIGILQATLDTLGACAIVRSAPMVERNHDVEYPYRQSSEMVYYTGWEYPEAVLIITPVTSPQPHFRFFVKARDLTHEVWTGPLEGVAEARERLPFATVNPMLDFWNEVDQHVNGTQILFLSDGGDRDFRRDLLEHLDGKAVTPDSLGELAEIGKYQRLVKSKWEIAQLQQAIDITEASLREAIARIPSLRHEYELAALIAYGFRSRGAVRLGFPSIVGSGQNSTYLHYSANDDPLDRDGVVLMDVGAEWSFYSADISRTVPVDGSFSDKQRKLYELVLHAQEAAIEVVAPGVPFREPHRVAVRELTAGLVELGLLEGEVDSLIDSREYRRFFMHGTSHWLGLDVHDAGGYEAANGVPHMLEPGMVLTVEPGLYIAPNTEGVPKGWWNLGIRIEDDVLVTENGHRVLSESIPKTVAELEAMMQETRRPFWRFLTN